MSILVGTASWTDKTLIESGAFYPPGCTSAEARRLILTKQKVTSDRLMFATAVVSPQANHGAKPCRSNDRHVTMLDRRGAIKKVAPRLSRGLTLHQ